MNNHTGSAAVLFYTQGGSDLISFHICQLVFATILWVKLSEIFVAMTSLNTLYWSANNRMDIFVN